MTENQQLPPEITQRVGLLNARIASTNLSNTDMLREVDSTLRAMIATIATLQKENAELKTKLQ